MRVRTTVAGLVAATLTASALSLAVAGPAHAADADDPSFVPVAADLIGVGSDTSQHAIHILAEGAGSWAAQTPAPTFRIASFAATGGGTIPLPSGAIARPNGSGAGKALLFGASNNTDIDFARSSSAQSAAETSAGLQSFPFALDTLQMAVSNTVPSNAPAALTPAQIVGIYDGSITDWGTIGGTAGTIAPKIPQTGSGTRSFFTAQLQAMNGGTAVTLAGTVADVQEHDDTLIKSDPNAIAPFSAGRAKLLGTTLRLEAGWKADRALYNVVRGADLGRADIQAAFGSDGFACSTAARSLIEAGWLPAARQAGSRRSLRRGHPGRDGQLHAQPGRVDRHDPDRHKREGQRRHADRQDHRSHRTERHGELLRRGDAARLGRAAGLRPGDEAGHRLGARRAPLPRSVRPRRRLSVRPLGGFGNGVREDQLQAQGDLPGQGQAE